MKQKILTILVLFTSIFFGGCGETTQVPQETIELQEDTTIEKENEEPKQTEQKPDESWKDAYLPIVKQWQADHGNDASIGYDLIYIDDNDVPELVLACDDNAWYAYDIYTCIDGEAVKLVYEDDNSNEDTYVSSGCEGKGDSYVEKSGIVIFSSGMMGTRCANGYKLDGNVLKSAFTFIAFDMSWDEMTESPFGYELYYKDNGGQEHEIKINLDDESDYGYYELKNIPEMSEVEAMYNCSFSGEVGIDAAMSLQTICEVLGTDSSRAELSDNEKYARILFQYMEDDTRSIREGWDGFSYQNEGGKFILKDINGDGISEMLLTVEGREYNLFVSGDFWEDAYVGNITAYNDDGILEREYGETFTYFYTYYKLDGKELKVIESFSSNEDPDINGTIEYSYCDSDGKEKIITMEEFQAGGALYGVHAIDGEWHEINEENINRILLQKNDETEEAKYVTTAANDGGVNMRSGPGTEYDILVEMIQNGEKLAVCDNAYSSTGKIWYKVIYNDIEGWVAGTQVK
ncbi:MAG: SH3 domain-containing protein [Lachnospiraceae bacterium]|nr:SH3 domain-containing protein [Lachnospiraceae bacterium]